MSATSSAIDSVETVFELLDTSDTSVWQNADPEVYHMWDVTARARENNPDPSLYVWSPVEGNFDKFSGDSDTLIDNETVEISVWTLDSQDTLEYTSDLVDFLSDYMEDNESRITWRNIEPDTINDLRAEHVRRQTDHYIISLQVNADGLRDAGL